jgi:shikimate dehydrogenase
MDLIIDSTSLGHSGDYPDIPASILHGETHCYSLNYGPAAEPLRDWCRRNDVVFHDGLGMLVEQAALSFEIWTGRRPETAPVLAKIRSAMA